jgi:hypothetical protein
MTCLSCGARAWQVRHSRKIGTGASGEVTRYIKTTMLYLRYWLAGHWTAEAPHVMGTGVQQSLATQKLEHNVSLGLVTGAYPNGHILPASKSASAEHIKPNKNRATCTGRREGAASQSCAKTRQHSFGRFH